MTDQHLSSRNRRTLSRIFQHPMAMNLSWRDVIHLFEPLGAHIESASKDKLNVCLTAWSALFDPITTRLFPTRTRSLNCGTSSKRPVVDLRANADS